MKVHEVISLLEAAWPLQLQETYDNAGLQSGDASQDATGVVLALDITERVVEEAIQLKANLVVSHHPLLFSPIKSLTGKNAVERTLIRALRNDIVLYSAHTNVDNSAEGVNAQMARKLGLVNHKVLAPMKQQLLKLVTFVPSAHADTVRSALFGAGAGHIGRYDCCSFQVHGEGTFRAAEGANPFVGRLGELHVEPEIRMELIFPRHLQQALLNALFHSHPYEEVAFDLYPLENEYAGAGAGLVGDLPEELDEIRFLRQVKEIFGCGCIRYSNLRQVPVSRVALCGGSGSFLLPAAIRSGAQVFLTADVKYHTFFDAEEKIVLADLGHPESEGFTIELFHEYLTKKLPNFAIHFSRIKTSPVNYI